jgi:acetyl-CoA synthetase
MNVSGHRLSTMEIESALVSNHAVAESAVVGATDDVTGQAVVAFVVLKRRAQGVTSAAEDIAALKAHVVKEIGAIARPRDIYLVEDLPKTRSGKIMRRLLRDIAEGREIGDTTTLLDTSVVRVIGDQVN